MSLVIISIITITFIAWLVDRFYHLEICPICVGVSLTWLGMLLSRFLGYEIDENILAMLIGASVVGVAYWLERVLALTHSGLAWKAIFIPSGFVVGYGLVNSDWLILFGGLVWLLILIYAFFHLSKSSSAKISEVTELEKKMKNCC